MDSPICLRQLLRAPPSFRTALIPPLRPQSRRTFALLVPSAPHHARFLSLPRIVQPSFWATMVPKPFKSHSSQLQEPQLLRKEWNPATVYIILGLLVGSQAIQTLWLKQDKGHKLRRAEAKIGILEEVIRRVQRGEDVDVEKLLGTGDPEKEREWAEVIQDLKDEEPLFQGKKQRKALREEAARREMEEKSSEEKSSEEKSSEEKVAQEAESKFARVQVESVGNAKFY